ncbi:MAG: hypothetical protein K1Y36_11890 [Blastocatellia bacterium]|nr:hypothetical protein [Blastocatellia bacterium]
MRRLRFLLIPTLVLAVWGGNATLVVEAGQHKKPKRPPKTAEPASATVGKPILITRVTGDQIEGKFVSIDMQKLVYENGGGEKISIPFDSVAAFQIGEQPKPKIDERFVNDTTLAFNSLTRLATAVDNDQGGITFKEYQQKVTEAKVTIDFFVSRYADQTEYQPLFATMRKIVGSYEMVSPIWAMRIGVDQRRSIRESTPEMQAILNVYPDLKATQYNQDGSYPTDKVVAWVWSKNTIELKALRSKVESLNQAAGNN